MMRMLRLGGSYKNSLQSHLDASTKSHYVDYTIHASIFDQNQVEEMEFVKQKGITSFKIYMNLGSDIGHVYMDMDPGSSKLYDAHVELNNSIVEKIVAVTVTYSGHFFDTNSAKPFGRYFPWYVQMLYRHITQTTACATVIPLSNSPMHSYLVQVLYRSLDTDLGSLLPSLPTLSGSEYWPQLGRHDVRRSR